MHQCFHAVGTLVGKQVGGVRVAYAEDLDHTRQRCVGARLHVQGLYGQPNAINTDHGYIHLSHSRSYTRQKAAPSRGQFTVSVLAPL
jgi:hypothetical protein